MFKISREAGHGTHPSNPNPPEAEVEGYKLEAILGYMVGPCLKQQWGKSKDSTSSVLRKMKTVMKMKDVMCRLRAEDTLWLRHHISTGNSY